MVTEVIIYNLKQGTANDFWEIFTNESLPLMIKRNVVIVKYGFSIGNRNVFHLLRNYDSLEIRNRDQKKFYNSKEWKDGPREKIMECIENYNTTIYESE